MGYHYEDFFVEHVQGPLQALLNSNSDDMSDDFIILFDKVLKSPRGNLLGRQLLRIISEKDSDTPVTPDVAIWNMFTQLFPDDCLRKVEYATEDGTLINIDYYGVDGEERK